MPRAQQTDDAEVDGHGLNLGAAAVTHHPEAGLTMKRGILLRWDFSSILLHEYRMLSAGLLDHLRGAPVTADVCAVRRGVNLTWWRTGCRRRCPVERSG